MEIVQRYVPQGHAVGWIAGGQRLITIDRNLSSWQYPALDPRFRVRPFPIGALAFSPDESFCVVRAGHSQLALVSLDDGNVLGTVSAGSPWIGHHGYAVAPDLRHVIAIVEDGNDTTIEVIEMGTGKSVWQKSFPGEKVHLFTPFDDGRVAFLHRPGRGSDIPRQYAIWQWPFGDTPARTMADEFSYGYPGVVLSRDGQVAVIEERSVQGTVRGYITRVRDFETGEVIGETASHTSSVYASLSSDGSVVALMGGREVTLMTTKGETIANLSSPGWIQDAAWNTEVQTLAIQSDDYLYLVADLLSGAQVELPLGERRDPARRKYIAESRFNRTIERIYGRTDIVDGDDLPTLLAQLTAFKRTAWLSTLNYTSPQGDSHFGGAPLLDPNEEWPTCGCCGFRMALFLQLCAEDLPELVSTLFDGVLQLFVCASEPADDFCCDNHNPYSTAHYTRVIDRAGLIRAPLSLDDCFLPVAIEGWRAVDDYPVDFAEVNVELSDEQAELLGDREAVPNHPGEKLLGWPDFEQSPKYPLCRECGAVMECLVSFASEEALPYQFGDGGSGHLFRCPQHHDVFAFTWEGG